jgi:hypothetical protein
VQAAKRPRTTSTGSTTPALRAAAQGDSRLGETTPESVKVATRSASRTPTRCAAHHHEHQLPEGHHPPTSRTRARTDRTTTSTGQDPLPEVEGAASMRASAKGFDELYATHLARLLGAVRTACS